MVGMFISATEINKAAREAVIVAREKDFVRGRYYKTSLGLITYSENFRAFERVAESESMGSISSCCYVPEMDKVALLMFFCGLNVLLVEPLP